MRSITLLAILALLAFNGPALAAAQTDSCGAATLQSFVGKQKTALPVNLPKSSRLLCSTCAGTMDYNPARLNVIYDLNTGLVTKISCG